MPAAISSSVLLLGALVVSTGTVRATLDVCPPSQRGLSSAFIPSPTISQRNAVDRSFQFTSTANRVLLLRVGISKSNRPTPPKGADRSKRQERVGHLIRNELAQILHRGQIGTSEYLEDDLRQRISVVSANVSPDLKQARISVSIRSGSGSSSSTTGNLSDAATTDSDRKQDAAMEKRRAYSWLVRNAKPLRQVLAQKMSHMKHSSPELQFVRVDVSAAVDVMYLIDKISAGQDKKTGSLLDIPPSGLVGGLDFDEEFDDEEWEEDDDSFLLPQEK